jgi:hypothetical protein
MSKRALFPRMALGVALAILAGCASGPTAVEYARPYPKDTPREQPLDIQVFRSTRAIELTNTTAHAFGPSTLWLNTRYSRPIEGLAVGQTLRMPLSEFRDRFSDAFRGGGFFAAYKPERLVVAELETAPRGQEPVLYRLIVVGGAAE